MSVTVITLGADELRRIVREEVEAAVQRAPAASPPPPTELYISLVEAHLRTGYHPETLRKWIKAGRLRAGRRGHRGHYRVRPADLVEAIEQATGPARVDPEAAAGEILRRRK